ncbi:MAG: DUF4160 domain-containing protein [Microcystaceae cyanobacterium]
MGKVDSFRIDGLRLFFNSHDHLPPHFHAIKSGEWEIRVYFLLCSQEKGLKFDSKFARHPPSSKEQKKILDYVLKNRASLLEEWEAKVCIKENL